MNVGVAAHITAASPGGPRYKSSLTPQQRKSSANGIWLCQKCAKLIDNDTERYTPEVLNEWRLESESLAIQELEGDSSVSHSHAKQKDKIIESFEKLFYAIKEASTVIEDLMKNEEISIEKKKEIVYLTGLNIAMLTDEESFYIDQEVSVQSISSFLGFEDIFDLTSEEERQSKLNEFRKSIRITYRMIESVRDTGRLDRSIQTPIVKRFNYLRNIQNKKDLEG